jgi:hypothetical protein
LSNGILRTPENILNLQFSLHICVLGNPTLGEYKVGKVSSTKKIKIDASRRWSFSNHRED